jgi:undecaprenyl-diphosphatase
MLRVSMLQIVVLAIVQGLTEFLPISSSGHLILVPALTGWPDQGLMIDVASHIGTLIAVLVYFWRDVLRILGGTGRLLGGRLDEGGRLALHLLVATVPALLAGYLVARFAADALRSLEVVAYAMIGFAVVLYLADRYGPMLRRVEQMPLGHALLIGCAQAIAFIPGTSRSGITMVAARAMGYKRTEAARFSFLLSIPAIAAAGLYEGTKLYQTGDDALIDAALWTGALSAIAGLLAIAVLMRWLQTSTFMPFVIYRLLLGGFLLFLVFSGQG